MHAPPIVSDTVAPEEALGRLAHYGFLLASEFPTAHGASHLFAAIRPRPTLAHFDPEVVTYWHTDADGRGRQRMMSPLSPLPVATEFAWGKIEIIDRLGVENEFVTLGGRLVATKIGETLVAVFRSPAPILRLGGHSQATDRIALELAAFFGRIKVPIDFAPGAEALVSRAAPLARYAAFIGFERRRYAATDALRDDYPEEASIFAREAAWLSAERPAEWAAGLELMKRIGLNP